MGKISRAAVHEAGHVLANIALGIRFFSVHVGPIWYRSEKTGLINMAGSPSAAGSCGRGSEKRPGDTQIVKVSGYMAERVWNDHQGIKNTRRFTHRQYRRDREEVTQLRWAKAQSRKILNDNFEYLVIVARTLNENQNHTFKESEILPLCDIWEENPVSTWLEGTSTEHLNFTRFTRQFKWVNLSYVNDGDAPVGCPYK